VASVDDLRVRLAPRRSILAVVFLCLVVVNVGVFTFAKPRYRPDVPVEDVNLAEEPHLSIAAVRRAFVAAGVELEHTLSSSDLTWLGTGPPPYDESTLYVTVLPTSGTAHLGRVETDAYEKRVGNVIVHYGGGDADTLGRVEEAVAALRESVR
jgi:hypothetical protein